MASRILFVDDEPSIRLTLPQILRQHGYAVTAVASVAEAIQKLSAEPFEVLIADLNVGEPGDGFTVVSAMRRVQPNCVNMILTGYPAFENALRAIRAQVDDFLVKPAAIHDLVASIEKRLSRPETLRSPQPQRLADCLRQQADEVVRRALERMKANPRLANIAASDEERMDYIKTVLAEILRQVERGPQPDVQTRAGAKHGRTRKEQGYSLSMLVDDRRAIDAAIHDVIKGKLLELDLSSLLDDLERLNDCLDRQLQHSLEGYTEDLAA
ncbi:MAG TPA: response regulator [Terriglobales bacterium]|nr:response regulator [Terriglobales bacterium]